MASGRVDPAPSAPDRDSPSQQTHSDVHWGKQREHPDLFDGIERMPQKEQSWPPTQFGIFYPRGYVVLAFRTPEDARRMQWSLIEGGYDEDDIKILDTKLVSEKAGKDLEELNPLVRALGAEADATATHVAGAAQGHTFLVAYAPSELDTSRLMNVARRIGYVKAQKYDRFTVTDL
jgi:hypothetical protein